MSINDLTKTPEQPDDNFEPCPDDLMEAIRSIHTKVCKLDLAVTGDRWNPDVRPGLMVRVAKLETHAQECNGRAERAAKIERKRMAWPMKLLTAAAAAAVCAAAGAVGARAIDHIVPPQTQPSMSAKP